jgi:hypothetical protein
VINEGANRRGRPATDPSPRRTEGGQAVPESNLSPWVPFFQTLLWVLLIGSLVFYVHDDVNELVRIVLDRARAGEQFSIGSFSLGGGGGANDPELSGSAAPTACMHIAPTGLPLDACLERGGTVLGQVSFRDVTYNENTAWGFIEDQVGSV